MPLLTIPQQEPLQSGLSTRPTVGWLHESDPSQSPCRERLECQRPQGHETTTTTVIGKKQQPSKSVRFDLDATVHLIPSRSEMSPSEVNRLWIDDYTRKENKQEVVNTIFLMRSGLGNRLTEEDYFCSRGLEHLVNKKRKKDLVRRSIGITLAMQTLLRQKGAHSPSLIAKAYQQSTLQSTAMAYQLARHDQAESMRKRRRARKRIRRLHRRKQEPRMSSLSSSSLK